MAEGYSTIANNGLHRDTVAIVKIEDRNGNVVYQHEDNPEQVVDAAVAADARQVLENVFNAGHTTWYAKSYFTANQPAAGKTGTTEVYDNLWFCGFTPQYTTVVRYGNRANSGTAYFQGAHATTASVAQPIWTQYMNAVLAGVSRGSYAQPDHKATYKSNSSWTFAGTEAFANNGTYDLGSLNNPTTEEEETDEEGAEGTLTGGNGVNFTDTTGGGNTTTGGGTTGGGSAEDGNAPAGGTGGTGGGTTADPGAGTE